MSVNPVAADERTSLNTVTFGQRVFNDQRNRVIGERCNYSTKVAGKRQRCNPQKDLRSFQHQGMYPNDFLKKGKPPFRFQTESQNGNCGDVIVFRPHHNYNSYVVDEKPVNNPNMIGQT